MNISKLRFGLVWAFLMLSLCHGVLMAQSDRELLADLVEEEQEAVNALLLYPTDIRSAVLNSTPYPEALIKMESLQRRTSTSFQELMEDYPRSDQEMIWDLTRYPHLITDMVQAGNNSRTALDHVLADYPAVIHPRARDAHRNHFLLLQQINQLNQSAESAFTEIIQPYPEDTQEYLSQLKDLPEVLSLLTENIRLTVLVGSIYVKDPEWIFQKADSLHLVVAQQNMQEVENWKKDLEDDPEAMEELKASAAQYAEENGYDDDYYDYESDYDVERTEVIVRHHYSYHYPYWFGYPHWYTTPRWRHYPIYYDWGYYYRPGFNIIVLGIPSFHFTNWYFHHHHHHHYYPHLSSHFVRHYHRYQNSSSSVSTSVTIWRDKNRQVISKDWMKDDGKLSERFKDYGKFEIDRSKYNSTRPKAPISQKDFALQNDSKYPNISKNARDIQKYNDQSRRPVKQSVTKPKVEKPTSERPRVPTTKGKVVWPKKETTTRPKTRTPKVTKPKTTTPKVTKPKATTKKPVRKVPQTTRKKVPQVKKGQDYHKQTWERSKSSRTKATQQSKATRKKPQVVKPKSPTKKKNTPVKKKPNSRGN